MPPFFGLLGMQVVSVSTEEVVMRMDVPAAMFSPFGAVFGGAISALLDTALGAAVACNIGPYDRTATHALNLNYVTFSRQPALLAKARVLRLSRTVAAVEGECFTEDGQLIAKALGTFGIFRDRGGPGGA